MSPELRERLTPAADSLRRLNSLVSPFTGVVRGADEVLAAPDDSRLANVYCETGHCGDLVGQPTTHRGSGSASTVERARVAAIGEAVERYSASWIDVRRTRVATARELGPRAVDPQRFALFRPDQYARPGFPYRPFTRDTATSWIEGVALPSGEPSYLPAQLVHLGWAPGPGEPLLCQPTSNGLACHSSFEEAALTGLLELLERDAFMITWRARISWPLLTWRHESAIGAYVRRYLAPTRLRFGVVDMSRVWDVPCFLGVARSDTAGDAPVGVGAAAACDVESAVAKALDEATRVRSWAAWLRRDDPAGVRRKQPEAIETFDDHVRHYAYDDTAGRLAFLDASAERREASEVTSLAGLDVGAALEALAGRLERQGASAYAVDVTSPDVREAGLTVVRVIAPELCPLDVEHAACLLGGRRLYEAPVRLGMRAEPLPVQDANPDPHPFP